MKKIIILVSILLLYSSILCAQKNTLPLDSNQIQAVNDSIVFQPKNEVEYFQHLNKKKSHTLCCDNNPYLDAYRRRVNENEFDENKNNLGF